MKYLKKTTIFKFFLLAMVVATNVIPGNHNIVYASSNLMIAEEITTLFGSARAVISKNQSLINDASKGDKGLSGHIVVAGAKANFKNTTGRDLNLTSIEVKAMLRAIRDSMDQAQPVINEKGRGFKGFLPAIFARQVADGFNSVMKGKMKIKLTTYAERLRNRANRPDDWENNVMRNRFMRASYERGRPFVENAAYKGKAAYRYILPEYYQESCLSCHGGPKGDRDITGGRKEGGQLGELGGAVSFTIIN